MAKTFGQWLMLSVIVVMAVGMLLILWAVWPLLPGRLPVALIGPINLEAGFAMLMLLVVVIGFGKLMVGR